MNLAKKFVVFAVMTAAVWSFSDMPARAATVSFTVSPGTGYWEYTWTVNYGGQTNEGGNKFGQLEVYLPETYMGTGTNANGGAIIGTLTATGIVVTLPWNAAHFKASQSGWTQARIDLESPDQEGFDPHLAEIAFLTNSADSAAGNYTFSYRLNRNLTSFFYELHGAEEADPGWQQGTAVVPLPASALLLGSGLVSLGLLGYRRKRHC